MRRLLAIALGLAMATSTAWAADPAVTNMDWRLVKQTLEWHAPGKYDDVLEARIRTMRVGTSMSSIEVSVDSISTSSFISSRCGNTRGSK